MFCTSGKLEGLTDQLLGKILHQEDAIHVDRLVEWRQVIYYHSEAALYMSGLKHYVLRLKLKIKTDSEVKQ